MISGVILPPPPPPYPLLLLFAPLGFSVLPLACVSVVIAAAVIPMEAVTMLNIALCAATGFAIKVQLLL